MVNCHQMMRIVIVSKLGGKMQKYILVEGHAGTRDSHDPAGQALKDLSEKVNWRISEGYIIAGSPMNVYDGHGERYFTQAMIFMGKE